MAGEGDRGPDTHRGPGTEPPAGPTRLASPDQAMVRQIRLEVTAGAEGGRVFASTGSRVVVGTHPSCDLVVTDQTVSRFHCEITPAGDGRVMIRDLDSRNGTLVDGLSIQSAHLRSG